MVKNEEEIKAKRKKYREENKDKIKTWSKKYRRNNKEKIAEHDKKYRENNRGKVLSKKKEYRMKHKERILNIAKEYYKQNKERIDMYKKEYWERTKLQKKKKICIVCGEPAKDKYCTPICMGIDRRLEKNHRWKGGPKPYDKNWNNRFKKMIRDRDANFCMICNRHRDEFKRAMSVHHIDGNHQNTIESNCISLCIRHHMIVEGSGDKKYTFWMPKFQKMLTKLYGYKYGDKLKWQC